MSMRNTCSGICKCGIEYVAYVDAGLPKKLRGMLVDKFPLAAQYLQNGGKLSDTLLDPILNDAEMQKMLGKVVQYELARMGVCPTCAKRAWKSRLEKANTVVETPSKPAKNTDEPSVPDARMWEAWYTGHEPVIPQNAIQPVRPDECLWHMFKVKYLFTLEPTETSPVRMALVRRGEYTYRIPRSDLSM